MKKCCLLITIICTICSSVAIAQHYEKVAFGDFEQWKVRNIKESRIIGGKTRVIYAIAPTDTVRQNEALTFAKGNPWSQSNAYAKVSGVEKASGTVRPEYRDKENGYCCRMDSKLEELTALGIIDMKLLVAGNIFTGRSIEPIKTAKDPYQNMDYGVPFTKRPAALVFDYKATISPENTITFAKGTGKPKMIEGHDEAQVFCLLQKRWEDSEGNIHALRVGTAFERINKDQKTWVNNHQTPIHYGDITKKSFYKDYMKLDNVMRARNSKGQIVPIQEEGWAAEGTTPTHIIISFGSGCYEAFVGREGNTLWIDNIKLLYND